LRAAGLAAFTGLSTTKASTAERELIRISR
jgi:hypothetical protein